MDINDFRVVATILVTLAFLGVSWWAFSPRRKKQFDEAANLPFADQDQEPGTSSSDEPLAAADEPSKQPHQADTNTSRSATGDDQ